jgi:hypothetical protein
VDDQRLVELSGLVATDSGYVSVNDSNDDSTAMRIFFLDRQCKFQRSIGYPRQARDPEDLAVAPDGAIWVADIGDNSPTGPNHRTTIALWRLAPGGNSEPVIYRLTYPDGAHDAEALVFNSNGTPVIVTKEVSGSSGVYVPKGQLQPNTNTGVELTKVGQFKPLRTGTPGFLAVVGQGLVTGGANAPDFKRVALRTYSDAYEWDAPDGDVVKAITTGTPRVTPLPDEPQGESIAYARDGKSFLTISDVQQGATRMLRYTPSSATAKPAATAKAPLPDGRTSSRSWLDQLSFQQVTYLVALVGVLGLLLVLIGVLGIRRSRQLRRQAAVPRDDGPAVPVRGAARVTVGRAVADRPPDRSSEWSTTGSLPDDDGPSPTAVGGAAAGGTTYGAPYGGTPRYSSGGRRSGPVYGAPAEEPDSGYDGYDDYTRRH